MREWLSGRASPCQGERREFESRLPLQKKDLRKASLFSTNTLKVKKIMKKIIRLSGAILGAQFAAAFLSVMMFIFFGGIAEKIGLTSIVCAIIYIGAIYSVGRNQGKRDSRNITGSYPDLKSNALAGAVASGINICLVIFRVLAFWIASGGVVLADKPAALAAADAIYRLINYPFVDFLKGGTLLSYLTVAVLPFVIYTVSYILGLKRYSFSDNFIRDIIYKKK